MSRLRALAGNTFRELLAKQVVVVALLLILLFALGGWDLFSLKERLAKVGDEQLALDLKARSVSSPFQQWHMITLFLAMFFGATAMASERKTKTILTVLARPVERWEVLLGKWLGHVGYFYAFLAIGLTMSLAFAWILDARLPPIFWLGVLYAFVSVMLVSGVGLSLGTHIPSVPAGVLTFALTLGAFPFSRGGWGFDRLMKDANAIKSTLAASGYYLSPSVLRVNLITDGLRNRIPDPDYQMYWSVLIENALYAVVVFILAAALFSRRDVTAGT